MSLFKKRTGLQRGWDYAQSVMHKQYAPDHISEEKLVEFLRAKVQEAKDFGEYNDFDRGIENYLEEIGK